MLKRVYGLDVYSTGKFSITAAIINLAAHLRGYYKSRHRVWAKIYLVYADESTFNHRQFYQNFGSLVDRTTYDFSKTDSIVKTQLELVKILAAYINDVYYVQRRTDFTMFTFDNILKHRDEISIVMTKNKYAYQIPAMVGNRAYIFRPSKYGGEDRSTCISANNVLFSYYNKINKEDVLQLLGRFQPSLLSLLMTINGCKDKNINSLTNITRTTKIVFDAIDKGRILNQYSAMIDLLYNNLVGIAPLIDIMGFTYRFKAIDLAFQHSLYLNMVESKDDTWLINLNDPDTVKDINNKYFVDIPLDLYNL